MHLEAEESGIAVWWCHVEGLGFEVALCVCFPQSSERENNLLPYFLQEIEFSLHVYMETEESGIAGGGAILLNQEQYFLGCQGNRVQLWQQ